MKCFERLVLRRIKARSQPKPYPETHASSLTGKIKWRNHVRMLFNTLITDILINKLSAFDLPLHTCIWIKKNSPQIANKQ